MSGSSDPSSPTPWDTTIAGVTRVVELHGEGVEAHPVVKDVRFVDRSGRTPHGRDFTEVLARHNLSIWPPLSGPRKNG